MSLQLLLHPLMMTRGQDTQGETDEFLPLNVEFLYLIKRAASPSFHLQLPRNKAREELISRLLLLKTTTCPSCILIDPTCCYYFATLPLIRPVQELASRPAPFLLAADPRTALLVVVTKREFELRAPRGHGAPEARACRTNLGDHVNKVRFVFLCWHDIGYCSLANPRPAALLDRTPGLAQAPFAMVKRRVTAELRPHVRMLRLVSFHTAYYDRVSTARRGRAQQQSCSISFPLLARAPSRGDLV